MNRRSGGLLGQGGSSVRLCDAGRAMRRLSQPTARTAQREIPRANQGLWAGDASVQVQQASPTHHLGGGR